MNEILTAYEQRFDPKAYSAIKELPRADYQEQRQRLDNYTTTQIQTLLGERYRVLVSTFNYDLVDGKLYGENMTEPAIESFKRGRDYRRKVGNGVDFAREAAEVVGIEKVQDFMADPNTPDRAMMLSISLPGVDQKATSDQEEKKSSYQHNFYDVFVKNGNRVEVKRFSSALTPADYSALLGFDEVFDDVTYLANPIDVTNLFETPDDIHKFFHKDHEYMDEQTFRERILVEVAPFIANYIRACAEDGIYAQKLAFNAIINVADEVKRRVINEAYGVYQERIEYSAGAVYNYGSQEVEQVVGGCGNVEGFSFGSAFRVSDYDISKKDEHGNLDVDCPKCGHRSTRTRGQLLDRCTNQACPDPTYIACK